MGKKCDLFTALYREKSTIQQSPLRENVEHTCNSNTFQLQNRNTDEQQDSTNFSIRLMSVSTTSAPYTVQRFQHSAYISIQTICHFRRTSVSIKHQLKQNTGCRYSQPLYNYTFNRITNFAQLKSVNQYYSCINRHNTVADIPRYVKTLTKINVSYSVFKPHFTKCTHLSLKITSLIRRSTSHKTGPHRSFTHVWLLNWPGQSTSDYRPTQAAKRPTTLLPLAPLTDGPKPELLKLYRDTVFVMYNVAVFLRKWLQVTQKSMLSVVCR